MQPRGGIPPKLRCGARGLGPFRIVATTPSPSNDLRTPRKETMMQHLTVPQEHHRLKHIRLRQVNLPLLRIRAVSNDLSTLRTVALRTSLTKQEALPTKVNLPVEKPNNRARSLASLLAL